MSLPDPVIMTCRGSLHHPPLVIIAVMVRMHSTYRRISHSPNPLGSAYVHRGAACEQGFVDDVCAQPVALQSSVASIPGSCQLVSDGLLVDEEHDRHQAVREVLQHVQWQPEQRRAERVSATTMAALHYRL